MHTVCSKFKREVVMCGMWAGAFVLEVGRRVSRIFEVREEAGGRASYAGRQCEFDPG